MLEYMKKKEFVASKAPRFVPAVWPSSQPAAKMAKKSLSPPAVKITKKTVPAKRAAEAFGGTGFKTPVLNFGGAKETSQETPSAKRHKQDMTSSIFSSAVSQSSTTRPHRSCSSKYNK